MIKKTLTIDNKLGLHARASAKLVSLTSKFLSQIEIIKGTQTVNGKSIMGVMMLAAKKGCELTFIIEGPDEQDMSEALISLITNRFHEAE